VSARHRVAKQIVRTLERNPEHVVLTTWAGSKNAILRYVPHALRDRVVFVRDLRLSNQGDDDAFERDLAAGVSHWENVMRGHQVEDGVAAHKRPEEAEGSDEEGTMPAEAEAEAQR
jgi:hypothetical protein